MKNLEIFHEKLFKNGKKSLVMIDLIVNLCYMREQFLN
jgi:hypothetical protein